MRSPHAVSRPRKTTLAGQWRHALLIALAVSAWGATAMAQAAAGTDTESERLFRVGLEALDRGDHVAALASLRAAYARSPRPIFLLNVAQALRAAGRPVDAIRAYREYIRVSGPTLAPERLAMVRATIEHLSNSVGTLSITSQPAGAEVQVNGESVGRTPIRDPLMYPAGDLAVEVSLEHHVIVRETVHLAGRQHRALVFNLAEESSAATLTVAVLAPVPASTRIAIDGLDMGGPVVMRRLGAGGHRVAVTAPGHDAFDAELILGPRQHRSLAVTLRHATPLVARPWFWLAVSTLTTAAVISVAVIAQSSTSRDNDPNTPVLPVPDGPSP